MNLGHTMARWLAVAALAGAVPARAGVLAPFLTAETNGSRAGMKAYEKQDWVDALSRFGEARDHAATPGVPDYNVGAAAYKSGDYAGAVSAFGKASAGETVPAGVAAYNLGNALVQAGQLDKALEAYRAALRADPTDDAARYNYEVTQAKLQQQQQQKDKDQQKQDKQDQKKDQKQDQQQQQKDQQQQQDEQKDQQQQQDQQQGDQQDQQQQQQSSQEQQAGQAGEAGEPKDPNQLLSPEEARRLLNAVTPEERELIKARLRPTKQRKAEKDW